MPWYAWVMVAVEVLTAVAVVGAIGVERKPVTAAQGIRVLAINAFLVWGIVALATR